MTVLEVNHLSKIYEGLVSTQALKPIRFRVEKGEFVGIMGPSGSGKTTLLNLISTADEPTSGELLINGQNPALLSSENKALFRRHRLGFVFQQFQLLDSMTIEENIILPLALAGTPVREMESRLGELADRLGLTPLLAKRPYELSGGQQQTAAIARAVIHRPALILADEPTGSLDSGSAEGIMRLLEDLNQEDGATLLMATHDPVAASFCSRVIFIKDGRFVNEMYRGDNRMAFFANIIDMLSLIGGAGHDTAAARY